MGLFFKITFIPIMMPWSAFFMKKKTIIKWYTLLMKQSSGMNNIFGYYHKRVIDRILVHVYGFFFIQV